MPKLLNKGPEHILSIQLKIMLCKHLLEFGNTTSANKTMQLMFHLQ